MEVLGYFGALLIGIILGITGGGGSILTVPTLVYILNYNPIIATAYSLFIVGTTSGIGTIQNFKKGLVVPKKAFQFAVPSLIGVYLTRKFIVPKIPDVVFYFGSLKLSKDTFLMILFAVVMFIAAYSMLKINKNKTYFVHCASGYRSMIFVSTLKARGYDNLIDVAGGFKAIKESNKLAISAYVCPSTLL